MSGGPFDTLKEFHIEPNSTFNIPVNFRPKNIGQHEVKVHIALNTYHICGVPT